ncbi:hypothetical protein HDU96_003257 [Phlyctochytrium bullatum]|nr:hypothetical protein HDU96_003257 [Phlyctochytrium bullatum]
MMAMIWHGQPPSSTTPPVGDPAQPTDGGRRRASFDSSSSAYTSSSGSIPSISMSVVPGLATPSSFDPWTDDLSNHENEDEALAFLARTVLEDPHVDPLFDAKRDLAEDLLEDYPAILLDAESTSRRSYSDENSSAPFYERMLMAPMRKVFALGAGTAFINNRFPEVELSESTTPTSTSFPLQFNSGASEADGATRTAPYFPEGFLKAPPVVLPLLASKLSGWDGSDAELAQRNLDRLIKPGLLERLRASHKRIAAAGCTLELSIRPTEDAASTGGRADRVWITFGAEDLATSTLLRGPVVNRFSRFAFTRRATNHLGKTMVVFREEVFEYCMPSFDQLPSYAQKSHVVEQGHVIGVDVVMDATVSFQLRKRAVSGSAEADADEEEVLVEDSVTRPVACRFETTYFEGEFPADGRWMIADLDSYIINQRIREEMKEPLDDDE